MPGLEEKSVSWDAALGSWKPMHLLWPPRRHAANTEVFGPEALP